MKNQNEQKDSIVNLFKKISSQMQNFQNSRNIINEASNDIQQDKKKQFASLQKQFYQNQQKQIDQTLQCLKNQNKAESIFGVFLNLMLDYVKKINLMIKTERESQKSIRKMLQMEVIRLKNEYQQQQNFKQDYYSQLLKQYEQKCETIEHLNNKIFNLQSQLNNFKQTSIDQNLTKKIAQSNPEINKFFKQTKPFVLNNHKNISYQLLKQSSRQNDAKKTLDLIKKILRENYQKQSQSSFNSSRITDFFQVKDSIIRQSNEISHKKYFQFLQINQQLNINANKQNNYFQSLKTNQSKSFSNKNSLKQQKQTQKLESISNFLARKSIFSKSTLNQNQSRNSIMNKNKEVSQIKSIII